MALRSVVRVRVSRALSLHIYNGQNKQVASRLYCVRSSVPPSPWSGSRVRVLAAYSRGGRASGAPGPLFAGMPALIGVGEFIEETREDYNSPTTSTFVSRMPQCRHTIGSLEEVARKRFDFLTFAIPTERDAAVTRFFSGAPKTILHFCGRRGRRRAEESDSRAFRDVRGFFFGRIP